jgi:nucleoside-diphosphate-sugar epimerase
VQGELWCRAYASRYGKPAVALRPGLIISRRRQQTAVAMPFSEKAPLAEYVGTDDVANAVERSLDYDPANGFDTFVLSAEDQFSTRPTLDIIAEFAPGARIDRDALAACDGFAAMVDTRHARETLGWRPSYRLARPVPEPGS